MIFELCDDLQEAHNYIPREHVAYDRIATIREALLSSVSGVIEQPSLVTQTLTNRMRCRPVSSAARALIDSAEHRLRTLEWWLRADEGIPHSQTWSGIAAVSAGRGLVHCEREGGRIEDRRIDSQQVVNTHEFAVGASGAISVAVSPADGEVAVVGMDGIVRTDSGDANMALRPRANCLAGLGIGYVGIDQQASLMYWDRSTSQPIRFAEGLPENGCSVSVNASGNAAVLVAGDRPRKQRLFIVKQDQETAPHCWTWPIESQVVTAACLDPTTNTLVCAHVDRHLIAFDVRSGRSIGAISIMDSPGRPLGAIVSCTCVSKYGHLRVVFADTDGSIGYWDLEAGTLTRAGRFRAVDSVAFLVGLEWLSDGERFLLTTSEMIRTIAWGELIGEAMTTTAVNACAIGHDRWITRLHRKAQRLQWFLDGENREEFYHASFRPVCVANNGSDGEVMVGGAGDVVLLRPGRDLAEKDAYQIFDRAVTSVLPQDDNTLAAVSETGEVKIVQFDKGNVTPIHPPQAHWRQEGACWLGKTRDIVCWGRSIADASDGRIYIAADSGQIENVYSGRAQIVAVAASGNGSAIHVAFSHEVVSYVRESNTWVPSSQRNESVSMLAAVGDDYLAVLPSEGRWLALWSTVESPLKTVAWCYLPTAPSCISTTGDSIVLGTQDGRHVMLSALYRGDVCEVI